MTKRLAVVLVALTMIAVALVALTNVEPLLLLWAAGRGSWESPPLPARSTMDAATQRGYDLRKDIEAAYVSLKAAGPLQKADYDLTALVTRYLPVGSSFDGAESILRGAGLTVSRHNPDKQAHILGLQDDVTGHLVLGGRFPCGHTLFVHLTPRAPGDYSVIDKVGAEIVVICL